MFCLEYICLTVPNKSVMTSLLSQAATVKSCKSLCLCKVRVLMSLCPVCLCVGQRGLMSLFNII